MLTVWRHARELIWARRCIQRVRLPATVHPHQSASDVGATRKIRQILDDWGLVGLKDAQRQDLLEILDDRDGNRSTIITSQLPIDRWHEHLGDPTLADAILDRVHRAHRLALTGPSRRKANGNGSSASKEEA
jgi:IstB-like ATP binding protein